MVDDRPFFRRPKVRIVIGIFLLIGGYVLLTALSGGWLVNLPTILVDSFICILAFLFWFVFFAQFILPVGKISQRLKLLERLINSYIPELPIPGLAHIHGPAIFIKDGKIIQKVNKSEGEVKAEILKRGPGVIWLDSASAAVLRTPVKFTRAVGPGIVFTNRNETIAGVVDLHVQRQAIGPGDQEDPFARRPEGTPEEKFKEIQDRIRWSTSGMTRDGIEVVASLSVTFKIDADEKKMEGGTHFGYNAEAVFKAIANEGINPGAKPDSPHFHVPWNELPAFIAVDVWREYLRKFTLSQLFATQPPMNKVTGEQQTALQFIGEMINARLKTPEVILLDEFGRPTGQRAPSREYSLIKDTGIRIIRAGIKRVCFDRSVEEQLIREWTANWLRTALLEREQIEEKRSLASHAGNEDAQKEFAAMVSREFVKTARKNQRSALQSLLQNTLKGLVRNPSLYRRLSTEPQEITEIVQWLRENA